MVPEVAPPAVRADDAQGECATTTILSGSCCLNQECYRRSMLAGPPILLRASKSG